MNTVMKARREQMGISGNAPLDTYSKEASNRSANMHYPIRSNKRKHTRKCASNKSTAQIVPDAARVGG